MSDNINQNPHHGNAGRHPTRDSLDVLSGGDPGMFGRMFPKLQALSVDEAALHDLADAMNENNATPEDAAGDNGNLAAGFTYLGQFIDHDITLDLTALSDKAVDPFATTNFRTPSLDLDVIYGLGPDGSPYLYARSAPLTAGAKPGPKLLAGDTVAVGPPLPPALQVPGVFPNDHPRSPEGFALIGDHRDDENLIVAQTHLAFVKFHNAVVDRIKSEHPGLDPDTVFVEARRTVKWHYQWIVLHDFVEQITEAGTVARILHDGRKFYRFAKTPFMPVEFSAAAYRLGHSMVRETYNYNRVFPRADFSLLFHFTGLSGGIIGGLAPGHPGPLEPGVPNLPTAARLPSNWIIDWRRFYDLKTTNPPEGFRLNHARKIDPFLAAALHSLPGGTSLPFRNLRRGVSFGLPSGQAIAARMDIANPLTPEEIATGSDGAVAQKHGLHVETPLWYYILKEAQVRGHGERLGPVGSRIVGEVFVGLVQGDTESYLWQRKNWTPTLPSKVPGTFTMTDLLRLVGDISPIDGVTTLP